MRNVGVVLAGLALYWIQTPPLVCLLLSSIAGIATAASIPHVKPVFVAKGLFGKDLLKADKPVTPESMGVIAGLAYFVTLFLFIPVPFLSSFKDVAQFPHAQLGLFLGGLLSLLCMLFLGFADDVVDIRWRVKIWFPIIASLPLLMVYGVTFGETHVVVPHLLRPWLGHNIDLGILYYLYMSALCTFTTNAINILAGMNGLEGSQALVIAVSIVVNDVLQILTTSYSTTREAHLLSLYFILPFIGVTLGYLRHNWYPAQVFGGDTFAYFAGMTISVAAIQGHFTKTVLLFLIPQIFNFLYSCPQLFGFVECPRHRMPKLNAETGLVEYSEAPLTKLKPLGKLMLLFLEALTLVKITRKEGKLVSCSNLTLVNLVIVKTGSAREDVIVKRIMVLQVLCSLLAFAIRYGFATLWY